MSSLILADTTFESLIQDFPADICRLATENGAFTRSRAVETPVDLLRGVLLYGGLDYSLREVAGNFTQFGRRISDQAVRKRLCGCERWLRAMLTEMFQVSGKEIEGTGLSRVILIDGTTIQAPGARTSDYRVHLGWEWLDQKIIHSLVTDNRTAESLKLFEWQPGDVVIADAAYATAKQLAVVREKGAEYIVRCAAANIRLFSEDGSRINVATELKNQEGKSVFSMKVKIPSETTSQTAYLHAFRLPPEAVEQAHARLRKRSCKRGTKTKAETFYLAGWTLLLTSLDPERIPVEIIAKLYRSRWQIEIVIKRLKSILNLDALRAKRGSRLAQVYLLAKIIYALMIERRAQLVAQDRTIEWRLWKIIAEQFRHRITLASYQRDEIRPDVLKVLKERPRKRPRLVDKISAALHILTGKPMNVNYLTP